MGRYYSDLVHFFLCLCLSLFWRQLASWASWDHAQTSVPAGGAAWDFMLAWGSLVVVRYGCL